jgi:hypothetical protein
MAILTYLVAGIQIATATTPAELAVGQIVMLPDGRSGEVTGIGPSAWVGVLPELAGVDIVRVRAWDSTLSHEYEPSQLQPWIEETTVMVDGERITGTAYHVRENGWPCVQTSGGRVASGPEVLPEPAYCQQHDMYHGPAHDWK